MDRFETNEEAKDLRTSDAELGFVVVDELVDATRETFVSPADEKVVRATEEFEWELFTLSVSATLIDGNLNGDSLAGVATEVDGAEEDDNEVEVLEASDLRMSEARVGAHSLTSLEDLSISVAERLLTGSSPLNASLHAPTSIASAPSA